MNTESVDHLERAHYVLQRSLYFTEDLELDGGTIYFAEGMSEPQWNHLARVHAESKATFEALLGSAEQVFRERGLAPAVEIGPSSRPADLRRPLADRGYELVYRYSWLVPSTMDPPEVQPEIEIRTVTTQSEADAFFGVFQAVYPDDLESGYERALRKPSFTSPNCEVVHHLAICDGKPAAVATSLHEPAGEANDGANDEAGGVSGLYNLAVHPQFRRRGLGELLTRHRVAEARRRGNASIFLQTEREAVERWQRRHGFRTAFVTEGYALSEELS